MILPKNLTLAHGLVLRYVYMCIDLSHCLVCAPFLSQDTKLCHRASKGPRTICICVVLRVLLCLLALTITPEECSYCLSNECSICLNEEYESGSERPQALPHGAYFSSQDPGAYQYVSGISRQVHGGSASQGCPECLPCLATQGDQFCQFWHRQPSWRHCDARMPVNLREPVCIGPPDSL